MKRALPQISLEPGIDTAISIQIAKPFAEFRIGKMFLRPIMHLGMPIDIFLFARNLRSQQGCDCGFVVGPPQLINSVSSSGSKGSFVNYPQIAVISQITFRKKVGRNALR